MSILKMLVGDDELSILKIGAELWDSATILWQVGPNDREPIYAAWERIFKERMPDYPQWNKRLGNFEARYYGKGRLLVVGPTYVQIRLIPGAATTDNPAVPVARWLQGLKENLLKPKA